MYSTWYLFRQSYRSYPSKVEYGGSSAAIDMDKDR